MSQSLAHNYIHLVFSTKNRVRLLDDAIRFELHAYMATALQSLKSPAYIINSVEDHVHLLFNLHRTEPLSHVVEVVKSSSSKWLKTKSKKLAKFAWLSGYGAFSVSQSNIEVVAQYIENQQEHHREKSFHEEFLILLKKHRINFDERYLWD